jgi:acetolactate synthase-1/2/3 large subunit
MVDAFIDEAPTLRTLMVRHEQAAVHLADGYYRVTRRQPLVTFTSVGPGAVNTLVGLATAMADSIPVVNITGNCQTYFIERGAIQDISHHHAADFTSMVRPVVKRSWSVTNAHDVPDVLQRAFRTATSGRPGPVHIELPMDIQAAIIEAPEPAPEKYDVPWRPWPDPSAVSRAAEMILEAKRPVLLVGGGVVMADASGDLVELADHLGIPVVTTTQGKGVIPEDHPLNAFYTGPKGSTCGTKVARDADLVIAIGFRFAEWAAGSYKQGEAFSIPPTKVIQFDIDPAEIGRNYPVDVAVLGDAKAAIRLLLDQLAKRRTKVDYKTTPRYKQLQEWRAEWASLLATQPNQGKPMNLSRVLRDLREALPREAIVVSSSGHTQGQVYQEFPVYDPMSHLSAGGFSTMGWSVPAAIGAKIGRPERAVVAVLGDGDFLMTCQELATAVQYRVPAIFCVINNAGFLSIRDMQANIFGLQRSVATESRRTDTGELYSPDFAQLAQSFGAVGLNVETPEQLAKGIRQALSERGPSVLDVRVANQFPDSGNSLPGWAEFPKPASEPVPA